MSSIWEFITASFTLSSTDLQDNCSVLLTSLVTFPVYWLVHLFIHSPTIYMKVKVAQLCPTLCNCMDYTVQGILQARILEWVAVPFSRGSSQPRIKPRSPALQAGSLPAEPPGKPQNTGVGSLPLLQQIFPTQKLNWGLLHCRWIIYQLRYQCTFSEYQVLF